MRKNYIGFLCSILCCTALCTFSTLQAQYVPLPVTGFNHDVVANGTGNSSLSTTSREMDAITPSNFVMASKQFATANALPTTYGLPDNGIITNTAGNKTYQMASYGSNNALYMFPTDSGKLFLATPGRYTGISLLVLATENTALVNVTFKFTDSTTQSFNSQSILDWFNTTTTNLVLQGFGRVKRKVGPFVAGADYEGGGLLNPHMYSLDFSLPCSKSIAYIIFKNVSSTVLTASNRAFVFAVSGIAGAVPAAPTVNGITLCNPGSATLSIVSPVTGVNYTWYGAPTGGFASGTGTTFTTPSLSTTTSYYVTATNASSGCISDPRVPVTVTIGTRPAAPEADSVSVCPNATATLTVKNPVTGVAYQYYTAATGGTPIGSGTSFTTGTITASTTYYIEAVNSTTNCTSTTRTAVKINFLPKLPAPVVQATIVGANNATFTWNAIAGATGYLVSINNGAFGTPSSGATGLTHVASGLPASTLVTIRVIATGPQACQNSDTTSASTTTYTNEIYIPNVFTPNGDGKNDIFRAYGNVISGTEMDIFNQWGEAIFRTTDNTTGWNGTCKGKQQPVGVYVYVIKLRLSDGSDLLRKGSINLVR